MQQNYLLNQLIGLYPLLWHLPTYTVFCESPRNVLDTEVQRNSVPHVILLQSENRKKRKRTRSCDVIVMFPPEPHMRFVSRLEIGVQLYHFKVMAHSL